MSGHQRFTVLMFSKISTSIVKHKNIFGMLQVWLITYIFSQCSRDSKIVKKNELGSFFAEQGIAAVPLTSTGMRYQQTCPYLAR